jgi:chromosome condensin MukBEF ATPase and DNA-binding subunit MukB
MAKLTVMYWRDIPSQVLAQQGRERFAVQLSARFQEAIDSAAMFAGKSEADAYMENWRKDISDCGEDLQNEAQKKAEELETRFTDEQLRLLIKSKGVKGSP